MLHTPTCCTHPHAAHTHMLHTPSRRFASSSMPRRTESTQPYADLLPWWLDQLHDWESAAAAGAPTTPPLQPETTFRLFSTDVSSPAFFARAAAKAAAGAVGSKQDFADRLRKLAERVGCWLGLGASLLVPAVLVPAVPEQACDMAGWTLLLVLHCDMAGWTLLRVLYCRRSCVCICTAAGGGGWQAQVLCWQCLLLCHQRQHARRAGQHRASTCVLLCRQLLHVQHMALRAARAAAGAANQGLAR
jgi:hypothetical protein